MIRPLTYYWRSILWLLVIFYLSVGKFVFITAFPPKMEADKIGHFGMYFIFSLVIFYEQTKETKVFSIIRLFISAFIFPLLFGGLMELLQHFFIKYRYGSWLDFLINIAGIFTAFCLSYFFYLKNKKTSVSK